MQPAISPDTPRGHTNPADAAMPTVAPTLADQVVETIARSQASQTRDKNARPIEAGTPQEDRRQRLPAAGSGCGEAYSAVRGRQRCGLWPKPGHLHVGLADKAAVAASRARLQPLRQIKLETALLASRASKSFNAGRPNK